jgi:glycosyltransferase involved in cell wall biosynthesis
MSRVLAIVPAFNEAEAIAGTVRHVREAQPDIDLVVIDDGSTDDTAAHAREAGARVLQMPFNLGIGGAVQAGYQYARENGYDYAVQIDGDGQHDAAFVTELLAALRADPDLNMVVGSRFVDGAGHDGFRSSASRRAGIRLFSWILSRIVGQPVTDPTSGLRMTDHRAIDLFARDYPHDYPEVEAIVLMHAHQLRSAEIPVIMRERQGGTSSITTLHSGLYMVKVLLAVFIGLMRARPTIVPGGEAAVSAERNL